MLTAATALMRGSISAVANPKPPLPHADHADPFAVDEWQPT
jgi:hypothetical protein